MLSAISVDLIIFLFWFLKFNPPWENEGVRPLALHCARARAVSSEAVFYIPTASVCVEMDSNTTVSEADVKTPRVALYYPLLYANPPGLRATHTTQTPTRNHSAQSAE